MIASRAYFQHIQPSKSTPLPTYHFVNPAMSIVNIAMTCIGDATHTLPRQQNAEGEEGDINAGKDLGILFPWIIEYDDKVGLMGIFWFCWLNQHNYLGVVVASWGRTRGVKTKTLK